MTIKCTCERCGSSDFRRDGQCRKCWKKEYRKAYYQANAEKEKAYQAKWLKENQEKHKAWLIADKEKNPEKYKARNRERWLKDSEQMKAATTEWRRNNVEYRMAYSAKYREKNREKVRMWGRSYLERLRKAGPMPDGIRSRLFSTQGGKCACCGQPLGDDYHLDHITPLILGGTNDESNLQLLRAECNCRKSFKHPDEYMQSIGSHQK